MLEVSEMRQMPSLGLRGNKRLRLRRPRAWQVAAKLLEQPVNKRWRKDPCPASTPKSPRKT